MTQDNYPDHVEYLLLRQRRMMFTEDVEMMEHGGLYGIMRSAWHSDNTASYIVTVWQWSQDRFDRVYSALNRGDWSEAEWRDHCFYYGWIQIGDTRCFGTQSIAESALLDMLEYPAFTMLKHG